jgi:hypothetical protein
MPSSYGAFKLTSVEHLPNVQVAFPGEHWSDAKAVEVITPGELVVPVNSGGRLGLARAASGTVDPRAAIALQVVSPPDLRGGSLYGDALGPNEIMNRDLAIGDWVHYYRSGAFILTLFEEHAYVPSDLLTFDPAATPQTGKTGAGAWKRTTVAAQAWLEVTAFRVLPGQTQRGILEVKSLRSQL